MDIGYIHFHQGTCHCSLIVYELHTQQQIEAQQKQIEALQQQNQQPQSQPQSQQEDVTQKLQKYADMHQKGILSDEEFQKLKADLLSKM